MKRTIASCRRLFTVFPDRRPTLSIILTVFFSSSTFLAFSKKETYPHSQLITFDYYQPSEWKGLILYIHYILYMNQLCRLWNSVNISMPSPRLQPIGRWVTNSRNELYVTDERQNSRTESVA